MGIRILEIKNIMGIRDLAVELSEITEVSGDNSTGKTSFYRAVETLLEGGTSAPELVSNGAEAGEIAAILDDGMKLVKVIPLHGKSDVSVYDAGGKKQKNAAGIIRGLTRNLFNAVEFIEAPTVKAPSDKRKSKTEMLIEALNLSVTAEQINAIVPTDRRVLQSEIDGANALDVIRAIHDDLYEQRRQMNVLHEDKAGTCEEMGRDVIVPPSGDWASELKERRDALSALGREETQEKSAIEADTRLAKQEAENEYQSAKLKADAKFTELSDKAERVYQEAVRVAREARDAEILRLTGVKRDVLESAERLRVDALDKTSRASAARLEMLAADITPRREELNRQIGEAETRLGQSEEAERQKQLLLKLNREVRALKEQIDTITGYLTGLERLKGDLLAKLPIEGLELQNGQILYDDGIHGPVLIDQVNTKKQYEIALMIAAHQVAGAPLPLILMDKMEHFSQHNYRLFLETFAEMSERLGVQFIGMRVSESPSLSIGTPAELLQEVA